MPPTPQTGVRLRPYQEEALAAVESAEARGLRKQMLVMPTGAGKTVVFASLIKRRQAKALVLAHREELIQQAVDKIRAVHRGAMVGVVQAGKNDVWAPVVVASVPTLAREQRLAQVRQRGIDLVICDEAHHAAADSYRTIFDGLGVGDPWGPLLVGVTATPDRGDRVKLDDVFDEIVYRIGLLDLIAQGYLCDIRAVRVQMDNLELDRVARRHGDYAANELNEALINADQPAAVALAVKEHALERKTIVFTASVELAKETTAELHSMGIAAEWVAGEMPLPDRRAVLARFKANRTRVVVNCMVLTEGFDEPEVDCVVIARPTCSRALYQQMAGRGLRTAPGKTDCLLIDVVGVTERHDLQTAASLAGKEFAKNSKDPSEKSRSLMEAMQEELFRDPVTGRLVSVPVDVFKRSSLSWARSRNGAWTLPITDGASAAIVPGALMGFDVLRLNTKERKVEVVAQSLDAGYAQGMVEDLAHWEGSRGLTSRGSWWRQSTEVSDKQLGFARSLRIDLEELKTAHPDGLLTKGAVSDAINARLAEKLLAPYLRGRTAAA
jgi:superfamily II DNA or RNA helicase